MICVVLKFDFISFYHSSVEVFCLRGWEKSPPYICRLQGFVVLRFDRRLAGGSGQAEKRRFRRVHKCHVSDRGIVSASYVTELVL